MVTHRPVVRFQGLRGKIHFKGEDFCFYYMLKIIFWGTTNLARHEKIWGERISAMLLWLQSANQQCYFGSQRDISLYFQERKLQLKNFWKRQRKSTLLTVFKIPRCPIKITGTHFCTYKSQALSWKLSSTSFQRKLLNRKVSTSWQVRKTITEVEDEKRGSNLLLLISLSIFGIRTAFVCKTSDALRPHWAITPHPPLTRYIQTGA